MKRIHILGGVVAAAVLAGGGAALDVALSGPGTPPASASAPSSAAAVPPGVGPAALGTAALAPGTALVDGVGRALYVFEADTGTQSTCTGACAQVWPPLLDPGALSGVTGAVQGPSVASSVRADGTRQVTYHGHPLYYFAGDKAPGETRGQGIHNFGGGWYVVAPGGDKIDPDEPAPAAVGSAAGNGY
jgi:predicted lipoprotein with Yx(FWY)xxD motif